VAGKFLKTIERTVSFVKHTRRPRIISLELPCINRDLPSPPNLTRKPLQDQNF
ncbi:Hypothetical protein FKW44_001240, partial [Caligus rogercresseyi]